MKKVLIFCAIPFLCATNFGQVGYYKFTKKIVPHVYEFNPSENPQMNYWCGHAALKSVGLYKADILRPLSQIHKPLFWYNSAGYRENDYCFTNANWCAKLQDLLWGAQKSVLSGGYGRSNSVVRSIPKYDSYGNPAYSQFFQKIKDGVNNDFPPIIPSNWHYNNAGHFWIVTGYFDTGNPETSEIFLRDVAESRPRYSRFEHRVKLTDFWSKTNHNGIIQILYVK